MKNTIELAKVAKVLAELTKEYAVQRRNTIKSLQNTEFENDNVPYEVLESMRKLDEVNIEYFTRSIYVLGNIAEKLALKNLYLAIYGVGYAGEREYDSEMEQNAFAEIEEAINALK